jgi:hypothetical protein
MRSGKMILKVVVLLAMVAVARVGLAQTADPAVNISAVVRGGVVVISYDLVSNNPAAEYSIALEASSDGGKTYTVHPKAVKGDVGPSVRAGIGKQITWQAAQDVENLEVDRYRYRVVAQLVRGPEAATTRAPQPKPQTIEPPSAATANGGGNGGGNGRRWGGVALIAGGGTLAVLGMTALKIEDYHTNKGLVWTGVGMAAGGVTLLALSGRHDSAGTQIMIRPGGVFVQHSMSLRDGSFLRR